MDQIVTSSPPATEPTLPIRSRWNWKRIRLCLLAVILVMGVGYWWQVVRLSSLERQFVGTWEGIREQGNGDTVKLYCELRADRTAVVEISFQPMPQMSSAPPPIRLKKPTWRESNLHLIVQESLSPWTRLQLQFLRIRGLIFGGTVGGFYPTLGGLGPIRNLRPNSFELGDWHMERASPQTSQN